MSQTPVVVDVGSGFIKAGFSGEDAPRTTFPSIVGRHKERAALSGIMGGRDAYVGNQAQSKRGLLSLKSPIDHGVVTNWEDMELLLRHTFYNELKVFPEDHAVILTEQPFNSDVNKSKTCEIMFEQFQFDKVHLVLGQLMSLYASGRTSGIVLDVGDSGVYAVPAAEGYVNLHAITSIGTGGRDLDEYLTRLLVERGHTLESSGERQIARQIKEQLCYIAKDYEGMELLEQQPIAQKYTLPDGIEITLQEELYKVPEVLFQPSMIGHEQDGVVDLLRDSISKVAIDLRRGMYDNIVLSGGSSQFKGFQERLETEIKGVQKLYRVNQVRKEGKKGKTWKESKKELVVLDKDEEEERKLRVPVRVVPNQNAMISSWLGASILGCTNSFVDGCFTKERYDEYGPDYILGGVDYEPPRGGDEADEEEEEEEEAEE